MKLRPLKNYTLLEILVVVAIIIILCTMLFGGFTQIKEMAKRTNCLNKTKDVALAAAALTGENGYIPIARTHAIERHRKLPVGDQVRTTVATSKTVLLCYWGLGLRPLGASNEAKNYTEGSVAATVDYEMSGEGKGDKQWERKEGFWRLVCDNSVRAWCNHMSLNIYAKFDDDIGNKKTHLAVYSPLSTGYLTYTNEYNSTISISDVKENIRTGVKTVSPKDFGVLYSSEVQSPSDRVYALETGQQEDANDYGNFVRLPFGRKIEKGVYDDGSTGSPKFSGYTAGCGGGGIGKESREVGGYASNVGDVNDNFDEIDREVMEGRHGGYVMHAFFDGSARAITADEVGRNQFDSTLTRLDQNGKPSVHVPGVTGLYRSPLLGGGDGNDD